MKPKEFEQALVDLGLNPTTAGRFFGVSRQHIYNMINGSRVPDPTELLINILLDMNQIERRKWIKTPSCSL